MKTKKDKFISGIFINLLVQENCHDTYSAWERIGEEVSNPFVDCLRGDTIFEDFELTGDLWWDDLAIFLLLVLLVLDPWLPL